MKRKSLSDYLEDDPSLLEGHTIEEFETKKYGFDDSKASEAFDYYMKKSEELQNKGN